MRGFCEGVVESPTRRFVIVLFAISVNCGIHEKLELLCIVNTKIWDSTEKSYSRNVYRGQICWFEGAIFS